MPTPPEDLPLQTSYWRKMGVMRLVDFARKVGAKRQPELYAFLLELANLSWTHKMSFDVMVAMSALETDYWRNEDWEKNLNPGSIGVGDVTNLGYSWASGPMAARAMIVHFMAYARGHDNSMAKLLRHDPRYLAVLEAGFAGTCATLADLGNGKWASDPRYAVSVASRYDELVQYQPMDQKPTG